VRGCKLVPWRWHPFLLAGLTAMWLGLSAQAQPAVLINEIHYHPVELPAFNTNGTPRLDLTGDVHEFLELFNPSPTNVPLAGWEISGDISYAFPAGAVIAAGGFVVLAKDPARLAAIPQYGLTLSS